jgi:hypothetical protein
LHTPEQQSLALVHAIPGGKHMHVFAMLQNPQHCESEVHEVPPVFSP